MGKRVLLDVPRWKRRGLLVAFIATPLLLASAGQALILSASQTSSHPIVTASPSPTPSVSVAVPTQSATPAPPSSPATKATPSASPAASASRRTSVATATKGPAASQPQSITFERIGLAGMPVAQMPAPPNGGVIEPPTNAQDPGRNFQPYWISSYGKPGAGETDSVYLVGHACTADCWEPAWSVFNHLGEAKIGDDIVLRTETGTVTYEVTRTPLIATKDRPEQMADTWDSEPGGMRIIACYPGNFDTQNVIVFAKLVQ